MFHVGQLVICIETWYGSAWPDCGYGDEIGPVKGNIYTIRDIFVDDDGDGDVALRLEEIINATRRYTRRHGVVMYEQAFRPDRFRPVHTTDISIFQAMLVPTPKEKVEA